MNNKNKKVIDIPPDIMSTINTKLHEGADFINNSMPDQITHAHLSWVKSFSSIIDVLDPKGNSFGDTLWNRWNDAKHTDGIKNNIPNTVTSYKESLAALFSGYLCVVYSLQLGKVTIYYENETVIQTQSVFHVRPTVKQPNLIFTLMPFKEDWSDYIWHRQIKQIVQKIEKPALICKRADDLFGQDVVQDIYESIAGAVIVIADITGTNPNVFYELGIAHTLGKDVILLTQNVKDIPFDLNRFRHCVYSNDGLGYEKLQHYVPHAIHEIISEKYNMDGASE